MLSALIYILRFGSSWPVVDEWDLTHVVLGGFTLWDWTFTRLNEHLFIPGNFVWYCTMMLSGTSFRAGMIVNLILHTVAALIAMDTAKRLRGSPHLGDVIIPALLLNYGHAYNLTMSYQIVFGCFLVGASTMLWTIATIDDTAKTSQRAGFALCFLMLNGGMGLAFAPPLAVWLVWLAWRSRSIITAFLIVIALAYTSFALFGAPAVSVAPKQTLPWDRAAWCVSQYLGMGLGLWFDGPHWPRNGVVISAGYGMMILVLKLYPRLRFGLTTLGFTAFLLGHLAVALGIALSRGGGIAERYVTISAIGFVALYLAMVLLLPRVANGLGFVLAVAVVVMNIGPGTRYGKNHQRIYTEFERDVASGMSDAELVQRHAAKLRVGENLIPALRRLGK